MKTDLKAPLPVSQPQTLDWNYFNFDVPLPSPPTTIPSPPETVALPFVEVKAEKRPLETVDVEAKKRQKVDIDLFSKTKLPADADKRSLIN